MQPLIPNLNNPPPGSILSSNFFNPDYWFQYLSAFLRAIFNFIFGSGGITLRAVATVLSLFFLTVIAYCAVRLLEIRTKEKRHLEHEIAEYAHHQAEREKKIQSGEEISKNERWVKILQYLFSTSEGDWKLAIIEADSMLEILMGELGFKGDTLGDKLKSATQENFRNLSNAWEVHTIRNNIAHEGSTFELSQREAKRVIAIYEQIFREFGYI